MNSEQMDEKARRESAKARAANEDRKAREAQVIDDLDTVAFGIDPGMLVASWYRDQDGGLRISLVLYEKASGIAHKPGLTPEVLDALCRLLGQSMTLRNLVEGLLSDQG